MAEIITANEEQTFKTAQELAKSVAPGTFIALYGDLGAGKTAFTRGFAKGLDIKENITSPTFTLLKVYTGGKMPLYHFDVYRIRNLSELDDIGFYDYSLSDGVCVAEWADLIKSELPPDRIDIFIEYSGCSDERAIKIIPRGRFAGDAL